MAGSPGGQRIDASDAALPADRRELNYRALFDNSPSPNLVLDRALRIVAANRAYLTTTKRELQDIVGRWAWDAFPTDPETLKQSIASFERVIRTGEPDLMPLLRFDVPRPADEGGGMEKRYWSISHVPVIDADGEVGFVLQHPIDVTELERLRDALGVSSGNGSILLDPTHSGTFTRAQSVHGANLVLKAEIDRMRALFAQAPSFMAILRGPEHRFDLANEACVRLVGGRDVIGRPVREVLSELEGQVFFGLLDRAFETGEPYVGRSVETLLPAAQGTPGERRFLDFVFQPMFDVDRRVVGIFVEGYDVTQTKAAIEELRQREERLRLVVDGAKDHAILTTDRQGTVTSWSSGAASIFGWP